MIGAAHFTLRIFHLQRTVDAMNTLGSISAASVSDLLNDVWPDEAAAAGSQYVDLIARAAIDGKANNDLFVRSEGDHAYGIAEAIQTLTAAATLVVTCVQLRHAIKSQSETRERIEAEVRRQVEDEHKARQLVDKLVPKDK